MAEITGNTRLFGIVADPVHHVQTPQRINRMFAEKGYDGVMVPFHVKPDALPQWVRGIRQLSNLSGLVVTVPHKMAMASLCDELTPAAARVGAVNVVRRDTEGRLHGGILDGEGFVAGLRNAGVELHGRSAYLAGAGGAACAIAFALAQAGIARLAIANRTPAKAAGLVERLRADISGVAFEMGSTDPSGYDLVVNATSLGMAQGDPLPLDVERLTPEQTVAEIVMHPAETALVLEARKRGCAVQPGAQMLACQIDLMAAFMGAPAGSAPKVAASEWGGQ